MWRTRGVSAAGVLLGLLVAVPSVMAATIGDPLNGWSSLKVRDVSADVPIDVFAVLVWVALWLAWLQFVSSVVHAAKSYAGTTRRPMGLRPATQPRSSWAIAWDRGGFTQVPRLAFWLVAAAVPAVPAGVARSLSFRLLPRQPVALPTVEPDDG